MGSNRKIRILTMGYGDSHYSEDLKSSLKGGEVEFSVKESPSETDFAKLKYQLAILFPEKENLESALKFIEDGYNEKKKVIVVFPSDTDLSTVVTFLDHDNVDQIILKKYFWQFNLKTIINVLAVGNIFGMEKYLEGGEEVSYLRFQDFEGRQFVLAKIDEVAQRMKIRRMRRQHAVQAAEELVMNALYNAPRQDDGTMLFGNIDPHKRVAMDSPKPVSLRYAETEAGLYMAVRDRFGALNKQTVIAYLKKCLFSDAQIDRKTIGAGLGIFLTIKKVQSYIVNVAPDVATEVIVQVMQTRDHGVPGIIAFFEY
jgi:hypothetical protein